MFRNKFSTAVLAAVTCAQFGCASTGSHEPAKDSRKSADQGTGRPPALEANRQNISNQFWWPDRIDFAPLRQNAIESNPYGKDYVYAREFNKLDIEAVKKDLRQVIATSQEWWPADYGSYGPFFIRMAWHSAGTYRVFDGRGGAGGGQQRFEPLNSWPDNVSLDKARRLIWPVKQKYGDKISWADLMVLTGNVALESMGFKTFGYGGGRIDAWEPDLVYWGPETKMLTDERYLHGSKGERKLDQPLGATQMGLIYVNPEGPNGNPDPLLAAKDTREAFGRMAMNDEETVALIVGGHTFGKAHGNGDSAKCVGKEPAAAGLEQQGLGWSNKCGTGKGVDAISSGLEGAWSNDPTHWSTQYLDNLFGFDWEKTKSPAGATQWIPKGGQAATLVPDAHDATKRHPPIMFTTDLALKMDPSYNKIAKNFHDHPEALKLAFAKAWFKLTHRDMGPRARYLGKEVPKEELSWQDPIPAGNRNVVSAAEVSSLKNTILKSGLTVPELVRTAWASASSFRGTDKRGGANGGRIRLAPEKDWAVNDPTELSKVLGQLAQIQNHFNKGRGTSKKVSLADLVVLGGVVGVEQAAKLAGYSEKVPFTPGRMDASEAQTDVTSFAYLEPKADAFRNFYGEGNLLSPTQMLVDRAGMLKLSVPEMTVLLGGMRVLNANEGQSKNGVFTSKPGTLSNDFFVNLYDMSTKWQKSASVDGLYEGVDRKTGALRWTATPVDLIFGSHSELRAVGEVYAAKDGKQKFVHDFITAWNKVMMLDRFDAI